MPTTPKPKKTKGKIGPLPVWGWAAVGAGVWGVYTIYRRHNANLAAAGATTVPLGVGTASQPGNGTPGAITTSTPSTSPTIAGLRAKFLAQATAAAGGNLSQAQALDAWNKFISGQSLTGVEGQVTKNIIANLSAGGFIPAGVSAVVHIAAPTPGTTTAHTPTAAAPIVQAYVPTGGGLTATTNKPAATNSTTTKPKTKPATRRGTLPGPTVRGGQPLQPTVRIGGLGPTVGISPTGARIVGAINNIPAVFQIPTSTRGTGPVNVQAPKKNKKKGAQGAYGLAAPTGGRPPAPASGGGFDLNPFHYLGF